MSMIDMQFPKEFVLKIVFKINKLKLSFIFENSQRLSLVG